MSPDYEIINEDNCKSLTNGRLTYEMLICLTGILCGVLYDYEGIKSKFHGIRVKKNGVIMTSLKLKAGKIKLMRVMIDLDNNTIYNEKFEKGVGCPKGIALERVLAQTHYASKLNFDSIHLFAARESKKQGDEQDLFGYAIWGKYGYLITSEPYRMQFENWALTKGYEFKNINDVYSSEKSEREWNDEGFGWVGSFDLKADSESWKILKKKKEADQKRKMDKMIRDMKKSSEKEKAPEQLNEG